MKPRACMRKIITTHVNPPIPFRHFDWSATFEGYDAGDVIGHGLTEDDAIADLVENALLEAYADGRKDQREDYATQYAQEQCETARSLAQMRD